MGFVVLTRRSRVTIRLMGSVKRTAPVGEKVVFGVGYGHAVPSVTSQSVRYFHSSPEDSGSLVCLPRDRLKLMPPTSRLIAQQPANLKRGGTPPYRTQQRRLGLKAVCGL